MAHRPGSSDRDHRAWQLIGHKARSDALMMDWPGPKGELLRGLQARRRARQAFEAPAKRPRSLGDIHAGLKPDCSRRA
jgi:hypothetical protein